MSLLGRFQGGRIALCLLLILSPVVTNAGGLLDDVLRNVQRSIREAPPTAGTIPLSREAPLLSGDVRVARATETPQTVPIEAYPWVLGLSIKSENSAAGYACGGVIIGDGWALTTADCIDKASKASQGSPPVVIVGTADLRLVKEIRPISRFFLNPDWHQETHQNDIALIQFKKSVGDKLVPLALPDQDASQQIGSIAQVVGWGVSNTTRPFSEVLQLIPAQILSREVCSGSASYADAMPTGQFCAQSLLKDTEPCAGFGGSPLILNDDSGGRYLAGIVSWGSLCPPDPHKPTVYTDVYPYRSWIMKVSGQG
jgi:trypsin